MDSPRPAGDVIGTNPPAGAMFRSTRSSSCRCPRATSSSCPTCPGMVWTDAEPRLRALGWTGILDKGADVDAGGSQHTRVVFQSPPAGSGRQQRRHHHAEVRSVAGVVPAHGRPGCPPVRFPAGAPACRRAPTRSRRASSPASGARPRSGSTPGGTGRRGSAARACRTPMITPLSVRAVTSSSAGNVSGMIVSE